MDYYDNDINTHNAFRTFVCVSLVLILGACGGHAYVYLFGSQNIGPDVSDLKYVVMQLTRGLSQVYRKHERLQADMERVTSAMPAVVAAAGRAHGALEPNLRLRGGESLALGDYDRQIADYALESAGARVLHTGDTVGHYNYEGPVGWALHTLTAWACHECQAARTIIQPGALPGECWTFRGQGEAVIRLLGTVIITGLTIEHIPPHIDPTREILSAPRHIQLQGLTSRSDASPHDFGSFEYNKDGVPIQYFEVITPTTQGFNIVKVKILSNWGHPVYTCLYRVRVHGDLFPGQAPRSALIDQEEVVANE